MCPASSFRSWRRLTWRRRAVFSLGLSVRRTRPSTAMWLRSFFALVLSQLASHAMFTASYSCSLPHKFGALLHEDPAVQQETLRWLEHVWATLCKLEELALDDDACAQFLRELVWPQLHYCREVLITLAERQWQGVPDDLRQHLLGQAIGFAGTKCVEDGFNFFRDAEVDSKSRVLSRKHRWHHVIASGLMEEVDMPRPPSSNQPVKPTMPDAVFQPRSDGCSLGMEELRKLGQSSYSSPGATAFSLIPMATLCMLRLEGAWHEIGRSWLSLLCDKKCIITRVQSKPLEVKLVCKATQWGAICLPVSMFKLEGKVYLQVAADAQWDLVPITDTCSWKVDEVTALPPVRRCRQSS